MKYLWTPWRSTYMQTKKTVEGCIFCIAAQHPADDETNLVVFRAEHCFVILNRYPYTSGHLMIVPYDHVSILTSMTEQAGTEMMLLARHSQTILQAAYQPEGFNMGMNMGTAAGAGIEQHLHLHLLPRWLGDANFMTTIGQARIIPEALDDTYRKLKKEYAQRLPMGKEL